MGDLQDLFLFALAMFALITVAIVLIAPSSSPPRHLPLVTQSPGVQEAPSRPSLGNDVLPPRPFECLKCGRAYSYKPEACKVCGCPFFRERGA